ncbi:unnamed protein product [Rotaria socialis]|uniref:Uncharacterized protein n=1 Tax=Rotaria socialis TaxID=392032 RepID=A0A820ELR9_9BILA|nr:unnamed protein product [Rotaria socialis]
MIIRHIYYSLLILIQVFSLIKQTSSCPIPFNIQSKCRCAITEIGRVYIYCARKQLIAVPDFDNSNIIFDELVLSGNRISTVHKNAFNGLKLRKLEFQLNPLNSIERNAFIDLSNYLEELILSTTLLSSELKSSTFIEILSELPNLKRLFLRSFDLSNSFSISNAKIALTARKLTQLSLQSCSIKQIDDIDKFVSLFPNLERLDLSENHMEYFNIPLILSLKKLKILILSKNKIHHLNIQSTISSLTLHPSNSLVELDLSYNALLTFEIDKNPLDCDCHLYKIIQDLIRSKTKLTGQCQTPSNHRNISLIDLSDEQLSCHINTLSQNAFLMKIEPEPEPETTTTTLMMTFTTTIASTTTSMETPIHVDIVKELVEHTREEELFLPIATTTAERTIVERIRISDLVITPIKNKTHVLIQWELHPLMNEEHLNDEHRRRINLKRHDISGFKLSLNSPIYKMSQLLDALQRNYTIDYIEEGEICLFLLRKIDYDKFCKQIQFFSTSLPTQTLKSSLILDSKSIQPFWHLNEPSKSILIGSILGILLVLILLLLIILLIKRCPSLLTCRLRASKYHQNNDSKSETLLVRPTPTNTIPWSPTSVPLASTQPYFYQPNHHQHPLHTRPISYQPSISTQCTCPTHYHSSGSSATDASASSNPEQNYHIYQEILNDDYKAQIISNNFRACRPLHIDTNSPPTSTSSNATTTTNPEQCQLCSLSVLV